MGQSPSGETYNSTGIGMPLINGPAEFGEHHPTAVQWTTSPTRVCKPTDILFCVRGNTTGRMNIADREYCLGRGVASMRGVSGRLSTSFLRYVLIFKNQELYSIAKAGGSTFPNIGQSQLADFLISIPESIDEQEAVSRALQTVEKANKLRQHELALERERKAALMAHLFTHGTRGEATKQTDIGEIPESWAVKQLRIISTVRYGLGQPPRLDPQGVPMIRATDIKRGRIVDSGILRVRRDAIPETRNPFLYKDDIIVVRSGAYTGDVALYDGRWESAIAGYDLVVSPAREKIQPVFLSEYLLGENAQRYFNSQSDRAAQAHLNAQQLGDILIPIPSPDEQNAIGKLLGALNTKCEALEREIASLDELFSALLEELMTGKVSVGGLIDRGSY